MGQEIRPSRNRLPIENDGCWFALGRLDPRFEFRGFARAMACGGSPRAAGLRRNTYPFCQHRVGDGSLREISPHLGKSGGWQGSRLHPPGRISGRGATYAAFVAKGDYGKSPGSRARNLPQYGIKFSSRNL